MNRHITIIITKIIIIIINIQIIFIIMTRVPCYGCTTRRASQSSLEMFLDCQSSFALLTLWWWTWWLSHFFITLSFCAILHEHLIIMMYMKIYIINQGAASINIFRPGTGHNWHFDESAFSVTLMIQAISFVIIATTMIMNNDDCGNNQGNS